MSEPVIRVSAVVLRDARGRVLTVRKRGTSRFMFPGGKPEPGETPESTAVREISEEVGAQLDEARLRLLGTYRARAANEAGAALEATVFEHPPVTIAEAAAEIAEVRWVAFSEPLGEELAPLCHDLAPLLRHVAGV